VISETKFFADAEKLEQTD